MSARCAYVEAVYPSTYLQCPEQAEPDSDFCIWHETEPEEEDPRIAEAESEQRLGLDPYEP